METKEKLEFKKFMLIGVLFLPTTNFKVHHPTAGLQSSSGQISMKKTAAKQSKHRHFEDDEFCEANSW